MNELAPIDRCSCCQGYGIYGGHLPPNKYAGPWKFCTCPAGAELRNRKPDAVDAANRARDTLIQIEEKQATQRGLRQLQTIVQDDDYEGEF